MKLLAMIFLMALAFLAVQAAPEPGAAPDASPDADPFFPPFLFALIYFILSNFDLYS